MKGTLGLMNRIACFLFAFIASIMIADEKAYPDQATDKLLRGLFSDYHEQFLILFPLEATAFGDSRYNDQLQIDIGEEFIARKRKFYESIHARLGAIPTKQISDELQLSAEILDYELDIREKGLTFRTERIPFNQFEGLPLSMGQMGSGAGVHPFRSVKDYDDWLKRTISFHDWSKVAIERFREGMRDGFVLPKILVERMVKQLLDPTIVSDDPTKCLFYQPIEKLPATFSEAEKSRLKTAFRQSIIDHVIPAFRSLGEFLRDEYLAKARTTSGISELPGGREWYRYCVRYWTTTDMTPDEIFAIGEKEVSRIEAEMESVKKEMGFDGSLVDFFRYLRTDPQFKPFKTPEEILQFFYAIQKKLEPKLSLNFLNRPKTPFEIRRTESFRETTASAEYMPGAADGSRPGVFYCPIPNASEFNITSGMESLFLHEALPGHHYQIALQQENENLPQFARFLWYGAYGEGWGLYCESIGKELGLYDDPKQLMGALGDEMHRAIRLVVDVGMHWKGWTREQAIEYMMAHEPLSEEGTIAEIERYMAYPAQALSYKIGQLKISQLRKECQTRLGERFSVAAFHNEVLRNGGMPLSIFERRLNAWNPAGK
jgi:uncharacterized protein (DUF885 family)